jgi:hypothetical protein
MARSAMKRASHFVSTAYNRSVGESIKASPFLLFIHCEPIPLFMDRL